MIWPRGFPDICHADVSHADGRRTLTWLMLTCATLYRVQVQKKLESLQAFLSNKHLTYDLQVRIRRHFRFLW